ncbi:WGR domain-containing protein [Neorhizobium sp. LMR1-1-1.1]
MTKAPEPHTATAPRHIAIQQTLFGETALVRTCGRIGKAGEEMTEMFGTEKEAISRFLELVLQKSKRGYRAVRRRGNTVRGIASQSIGT